MMISSWFSSTRLFYSFFLVLCNWSIIFSYYAEASDQCVWDNSLTCYHYRDFCLTQCPTLLDIDPNTPYNCVVLDNTKRLIFNFHQISSVIGDSNTPSLYSFDASGILANSLSSPTIGYERGLYFSSGSQYLRKNSGSIFLSLDYTWIFWAKFEGSESKLTFLEKSSSDLSNLSIGIYIWNDGIIDYIRSYCLGSITKNYMLGATSLNNPSWTLYKIVQTYFIAKDSLPGQTIQMWINDNGCLLFESTSPSYYNTYDSPDNDLTIGGGFIGWIYELIYIPLVDLYTWPQYYINNFFYCPKSLAPLCLISCKPNEYYEEFSQHCFECSNNCADCISSDKCGLCNNWCTSTCSNTKTINACDSNFCPSDSAMSLDTCICNDNAFYYNKYMNQCVICPENSIFSVDTCICNDSQFYYDRYKNQCLNCPEASVANIYTCICNDNTFYYDIKLGQCVKCDIYPSLDKISAGFSYDYTKILVNFTVEVKNIADGCSNLFESSVILEFGDSPTCSFNSDFTQIVITLGSGYKFGGGVLSFKIGVLLTVAQACRYNNIGLLLPVALPLPSPIPKIILLGPSEIIASCQDLILNGIIDPGLPYEEYKWDIFSDNALMSSYSTSYSSSFVGINIPRDNLSTGVITASLSAKNPFKVTTVIQKITISPSGKLAINFDSSIPKTISRLKSYSLAISSISACSAISENLQISWSIASVTNNMTSIDEKSLWENNMSSDIQLFIPPKIFPELTTITFHVHAYDYVNKLEGDADLTIQTDSNSPVILFDRADGPIGVNQQLNIDAGDSYDPDGTSSTMLYQWICITNSIDCSNIMQSGTSIKLTVPGNSLSIGEIYNFTLTITKIPSNAVQATNKSSKSIIITCISQLVPIISIYEITQVFNRPNTNTAYRLGIKGLSSTDTNLWALIKGPPIDLSTSLTSQTLAIKEDSLIQGESYTLQVLINDKFSFTWSFNVNRNPTGGILKVTPDIGVEMSTIFTISALDWTDPDGDLPLQYSFGYYINNIYQALNAKNLTSIIYSQFPYSQEQIIISANIYDSLSAKTSVNSTLSVSLQGDLDTEQAIYNLTGKIFASTTPSLSIPLYVSQIAALSSNRQYLLNNSYSQLNEYIQYSYDVSINAIFLFMDAMNPYDSDSSEAIGTMLSSITQNPNINTINNIKRVGDFISSLQAATSGKSNLSNRNAQTLVDVSSNEFQVHNDFLENNTDIVREIDNNLNKINAMALGDMVIRERKQCVGDKINVEISKQYVDELTNATETVKNSSIILSPDIQNFVEGKSIVGTSFVNYDPIPNKENATLSIVSFNFIDPSTSTQISLKNISNQTIIISASNFDPEIIYSSPDPPKKPINSTSSNGTYIYTLNCSYLEDKDWKTEDCKLESYNQTHVSCKCTRLGVFTAMVKAIWISFVDNNAGDIINVSVFSNIDWDNVIGLYFVIGIIVFHSILTMKTLQMDWVKKSNEISEIENSSNITTNRSDESIINYYLRNHKTENNAIVNIEDLKPETNKENSNQNIKIVLRDHELIRIFMTHDDYSHFSLATIYSTLLLGNMFFIGLFYQNDGNSNKDWGFNLKELIENYDFRDFWASVYATFFTFGLGIILNFLARIKKNQNECIEYPITKKFEKRNKIKITIFYLLSYGLIIFFSWSIILFSIQFDLSISCKWVYNTLLNFIVNILCVAFLKIALKLFIFWLLSKAWSMIRSDRSKTKKIDSHRNIAPEETRDKDSPESPQKFT